MMTAKKVAFLALEYINDQIRAGVDMDGKPYKYSSKPFARPAGKSKFNKALFKGEDPRLSYTNKRSKKWLVVHGGYKDWRTLNNRNPDGDWLVWSGNMLNAMSATSNGNQAIVYFTDTEVARRAYWFNESGVGKSRKLWKFLGLTKDNLRKLGDFAATEYAKELKIEDYINL